MVDKCWVGSVAAWGFGRLKQELEMDGGGKKKFSGIYFRRFSNFQYRVDRSLKVEFERLAGVRGWKRGARSGRFEREWVVCLRVSFEELFGSGVQGVEAWRRVCGMVGVREGSSVRECKKVWIVWYDLVLDVRSNNLAGFVWCVCEYL